MHDAGNPLGTMGWASPVRIVNAMANPITKPWRFIGFIFLAVFGGFFGAFLIVMLVFVGLWWLVSRVPH